MNKENIKKPFPHSREKSVYFFFFFFFLEKGGGGGESAFCQILQVKKSVKVADLNTVSFSYKTSLLMFPTMPTRVAGTVFRLQA